MYNRIISLPKNRSFFLFGQRGTGKTSLIRSSFRESALILNLLDSKIFLDLVNSPWKLREYALSKKTNQELIVIDEIQKIPALLDEVHLLIEEHNLKFALTGSSARKLKRAGVNLLAGRALDYKLYPLTHRELGEDFQLEQTLQWGSLPITVTEHDEKLKEEYLYAYVTSYLEQEIVLEQVVRQIEPFTKFLEIAAQSNNNLVNYENIAKDVKVSAVSVKTYFQILIDTLIGFYLPAFSTSIRKRQKVAPKFYFYDIGLLRALQKTLLIKPIQKTFEYGLLFETFIINEIVRLNEYYRCRFEFSHLRLADDAEIDLIIERPGKKTILLEIKSKENIDERDVSKLSALAMEIKNSVPYYFCMTNSRKLIKNVLCLNWREGIDEIFQQ